jgi:hypothetical protein
MGDMDVQVGVDPDGELGRGGVCHAGDGRLLSFAGAGWHARRPGGQHCDRSGRQARIRSRPSGWRAGGGRGPGPTGQIHGTKPVDNRVRPSPQPPPELPWRPQLGSTGQEQGTQPAESRVRPSPRPPSESSQWTTSSTERPGAASGRPAPAAGLRSAASAARPASPRPRGHGGRDLQQRLAGGRVRVGHHQRSPASAPSRRRRSIGTRPSSLASSSRASVSPPPLPKRWWRS